jgi:hypothetical protein
VTRRLIGEFASRTREVRTAPTVDHLTPREREVVTLVASGLSMMNGDRQITATRGRMSSGMTKNDSSARRDVHVAWAIFGERRSNRFADHPGE